MTDNTTPVFGIARDDLLGCGFLFLLFIFFCLFLGLVSGFIPYIKVEAGQKWEVRGSDNPFDAYSTNSVIEVKEGWVKYYSSYMPDLPLTRRCRDFKYRSKLIRDKYDVE